MKTEEFDQPNEELVTIKTFYYDHETLLYEPRFQDAGIYYFMKDQKTVAIDPLVSNSIGGIKLQVKRNDLERAMVIINDIKKEEETAELENNIVVDNKKFLKTLEECPKCKSENVYQENLSFISSVLKSFSKKRYYCGDCKNKWEQ